MIDFMNLSSVIRLTTIIVMSGMLISTLEYIFNIRQCGESGLFSWAVWQRAHVFKSTLLKKLVRSSLFNFYGVTSVLIVRLFLILFILYNGITNIHAPGPIIMTLLLATQFYINFRYHVGKDGSDQMSTIIVVMLCIISYSPNNMVIVNACILFIAFQSVASYITAGVAKLISPQWRSGDIILGVISTKTYGNRWFSHFLNTNPTIRRFLSHTTVAFECLFFLLFFLPYPYNLYALVIPFSFHLGCAIFMGLNGFIFAFTATYPSLIYVANHLHRVINLL